MMLPVESEWVTGGILTGGRVALVSRRCFAPKREFMFLNRTMGTLAAIWGIVGSIAILGYAIVRMAQHANEAIEYPWGIQHFLVLMIWVAFMAFSEGYRGFQRNFSPRVAARAIYLIDRSTITRLVLAPLFCMAFFGAPRKRRVTVIILTLLIATIVIVFRFIPQPWRGILDIGVIIGLGWGIVATLVFVVRYWMTDEVTYDAEVIEPEQCDG